MIYKFEDNRGILYEYNQRQQELMDDIYECFCGKEFVTHHNFWYEKFLIMFMIWKVMLKLNKNITIRYVLGIRIKL